MAVGHRARTPLDPGLKGEWIMDMPSKAMPECYHDDTLELEYDDDGTVYKCDLCGETWLEPYE